MHRALSSFSGWILAGLGNPGARYAGTRHDLGFMLVHRLAAAAGAGWRSEGGAEVAGPVTWAGPDGPAALLVKPLQYMNLSGPPLLAVMTRWEVPPSRVLVACDDINLPLGKLRLRPGGSAGGHNGLSSVIGCLGPDFARLRLGVGKEPDGAFRADWVLSRFRPDELADVAAMLERAQGVVRSVVEGGVEAAVRGIPG